MLRITDVGRWRFFEWLELGIGKNARSIRLEFLTRLYFTQLHRPENMAQIYGTQFVEIESTIARLESLLERLPPSVAGLDLLIAFGRRGVFGSALSVLGISLPFTTAAVILAQTFVAAPLYVRSARVGFAHVEKQLEEAAHVEGANQWQLFSEVMFPLAGRALFSGAILTWSRALGEFGATILFAGNLEGVTQTMPMAIYLGFERNLGIALALSTVLVFVLFFLLLVTRRLEDHRDESIN